LAKELYKNIAETIEDLTGVQLGEKQSSLITTRLAKRINDLGYKNINEYYDYYLKNKDKELSPIISLLTTHHTFFFREFIHFEWLLDNLPSIVKRVKRQGRNKIMVWSAACSYGHEVYSLLMFLNYHLHRIDPSMDFEIVGTDICEASVKRAKNGVYKWSELKKSPSQYISGNWLKGTGDIENYVKIKKDLQKKCKFQTLNLISINPSFSKYKFDIIFCRNVFIYFTQDQISKIVSNFEKHLFEDSDLIVGLSERVNNFSSCFTTKGSSVYKFKEFIEEKVRVVEAISSVKEPIPVIKKAPIRLLHVDDSETILKLLGKMFGNNKDFEVVGTAKNGIEARDFLVKNPNTVDVITLDIHMPEENGIQFLENIKKESIENKPKIVMLSSVSEEDSSLALKSFELGAVDYIEKPNLNNFLEKKEELERKIKSANLLGVESSNLESGLLKEFSKETSIVDVENKSKIILVGMQDINKVEYIMQDYLSSNYRQTSIFFLFENYSKIAFDRISKNNKDILTIDSGQTNYLSEKIYCGDLKEIEILLDYYKKSAISSLIAPPNKIVELLKNKAVDLIIEDSHLKEDLYKGIYDLSKKQLPYTSHIYELDYFLGAK